MKTKWVNRAFITISYTDQEVSDKIFKYIQRLNKKYYFLYTYESGDDKALKKC